MTDVYEISGPYTITYSAPPVASYISTVQRSDKTYLVDIRYYLSKDGSHHRYGSFKYGAEKYGPDDFQYSSDRIQAKYSIDNGDNWLDATPQPYDRKHSPDTVLIDATPQNLGFVWNSFSDLPEEWSGSVLFRLEFTGSSSTIITSSAFTVSSVVSVSTTTLLAERRRAFRVDDFLGEGPIVPWVRGPTDFGMARGKELIASSVRSILKTKAATNLWGGELEWDPSFGSLFWSLKHSLADEMTIERAAGFAEIALNQEPRLELVEVTPYYEVRDGSSVLFVTIKYAFAYTDNPSNRVVLSNLETLTIEV